MLGGCGPQAYFFGAFRRGKKPGFTGGRKIALA